MLGDIHELGKKIRVECTMKRKTQGEKRGKTALIYDSGMNKFRRRTERKWDEPYESKTRTSSRGRFSSPFNLNNKLYPTRIMVLENVKNARDIYKKNDLNDDQFELNRH